MRSVVIALAMVVLLSVAAVAALLVGLNTGYGRGLAVTEINKWAGPQLHIAGLAGHFPEDIKLRAVAVSDAKGVYATGADLELRWQPQRLLSRVVAVTQLTAGTLTVLRAPVAGKPATGGGGMPALALDVAQVRVGALHVGPALAGQALTGQALILAVAGHLRLDRSFAHGNVALDAVAAGGLGTYHVAALIDPALVNVNATIDEPPDGLIGHIAGPRVRAPLHVAMTLAGPRAKAKLDLTASVGKAVLDGAGFLGLDVAAPRADVVLTVPALAPVAGLTGQSIAGASQIHVVASSQNNVATVALDGDVDLTAGPGPAVGLLGPRGQMSALLTLAGHSVTLRSLHIAGAGFTLAASGDLSRQSVSLHTSVAVKNVGLLSKGITGPVSAAGDVAGTANDFAVNATVTGNIARPGIPSGPFALNIDARHLPSAPQGTVSGSGALENDPLKLDADFSRGLDGVIAAVIRQLSWRSLSASGDIQIRPGAALPFGQARFAVGSLADLSPFLPVKLSGSVTGDFSHQDADNFSLNLQAKSLVAPPPWGAIDARLSATGPERALAVNLQGSTAKLINAPARVSMAGVLNIPARAAAVSNLTMNWRNVSAALLAPAVVTTMNGIAVRHAALSVNGGTIRFDGAVTPKMDFTLSVQNLPANLVSLAAPVKAAGMINMTAALTGTPQNPAGAVTLSAQHIKVLQGVAASLPTADFAARLQIAGKTANVTATLGLGPDVRLAASGLAPLDRSGPISMHLTGVTDLRLLDPIIGSQGTTLRGVLTPDVVVTGTPVAPVVNGSVSLAGGSVQDLSSGLNLTQISARLAAAGRLVTLQNMQAQAGAGTISAHGTVDLSAPDWPIDLVLRADKATPVSSDLATESADAALTLKGDARGAMALAGNIDLWRANINIPKSLPPDVANLPILNHGQKPPPAPPPPPDVSLDLTIRAKNQIFIRGDGLFAELGGKVRLAGTLKNPAPEGGFTLIRGSFALAGKTLQFTQGTVNFTGDGFVPTLDLEASTTTAQNTTASLIIGGTAEKPTITLTASPPLPSDEVLSQLLFGEATSSLSPFQAASLAAALASLSGVGGSAISDPLGGVRGALGLDELSLGGNGAGAPTVNAGRYVAPGVYVGAQQSTTGQGTQATVQINLLKGLQLQTSTGTSAAGSGNSSSVGLTYQFNY